jgi:phage terminase large subunit-like protein
MTWTPPQAAIHRLPARRKLLRAGNQIGKTTASLAEVIWRCIGAHPHYPTHPPPIEAWVVCTSWSQSVAIMRKFAELCPAELLDPKASSNFSIRNGYGKDNPAVIFRCGSIVRFRTTNQGPEALQGATIDYVLVDEPTDIDIYRELDRRLTRSGGTMCLSLTPANRDCAWLRDLVAAGAVQEVHATLTVANLTPEGETTPLRLLDGTPMDEAWIASQWRTTPAAYAGVVLDGEWETRPDGVFFRCFDPKRTIAAARLDPNRPRDADKPQGSRAPIRWVLGIDYAAADREYGQTAMLCQVQETTAKGRERQAVLVVDEVVQPGASSNAQFAAALVTMLQRHGLRWTDLHAVHGDNPVASRWVERSNLETMRYVARELGVSFNALSPRIQNAKEGGASAAVMDAGCRYLYEQIAEGALLVHPRCVLLADALATWDYGRMHPAKDRIDALRYGLRPWIHGKRMSAVAIRVR